LPGGIPDWENPSPVCSDMLPITLMPDSIPIGGEPASWSGAGITDNGDYTATFDPPVNSGVFTVTYCVGDGICEECLTQAIEVFACVDAETVDDDIVCASSSNCYDLEQQYEPTTTPGGVWGNLADENGLPYSGPVTLNGTNICYDPATFGRLFSSRLSGCNRLLYRIKHHHYNHSTTTRSRLRLTKCLL